MSSGADLAARAAALAELKAKEEIRKLKHDNSLIAQFVPIALSGAAVVVTGSQFFLAVQTYQHQQATQRNDFQLRCVEAGMKAADYSEQLREKFAAADESKQIATLNVVMASLPPHTAQRVLDAVGSQAITPRVKDAYLAARDVARAATEAQNGGRVCPEVDYVGQEPQAEVSPATATASDPSSVPTAVPVSPLNVYVQIVRPQDRVAASKIMGKLPASAEFPHVFPADLVLQRDPMNFVGQIRYYYADQMPQAEKLAKEISAAATDLGIAGAGNLQVKALPARFSNLPRDRIEVWFGALQPE